LPAPCSIFPLSTLVFSPGLFPPLAPHLYRGCLHSPSISSLFTPLPLPRFPSCQLSILAIPRPAFFSGLDRLPIRLSRLSYRVPVLEIAASRGDRAASSPFPSLSLSRRMKAPLEPAFSCLHRQPHFEIRTPFALMGLRFLPQPRPIPKLEGYGLSCSSFLWNFYRGIFCPYVFLFPLYLLASARPLGTSLTYCSVVNISFFTPPFSLLFTSFWMLRPPPNFCYRCIPNRGSRASLLLRLSLLKVPPAFFVLFL